MRKNLLTKFAAIATAAVLSVACVPALLSSTHAAQEEYSYVYAGLTWQEYWANENVYNAGDATTSSEKDSHGEFDKGSFDTVTRATSNHGLHRGSYQCMTIIDTEEGKQFELAGWSSDGKKMILTDGTEVGYSKGQITENGITYKLKDYEVTGIKYVPVKVKTSDLAEFEQKYRVVKNGEQLFGGYGESNLSAYTHTAKVNDDTNGLKTATKNADGTFSFSARQTTTGDSFADQAILTATDTELTVKEATGSYGEFLRVDINGAGYGKLGAMMQAVKWTYYGNDETRTTAVAVYGTKFASDNWMHKTNGIQLGLTDSARCQLPEGYDGTGYWSVTLYALGFEDTTYNFTATDANIVKVKEKVSDTSKLEAAILQADGLNESDYTADSWAAMKLEYDEAEEALATAEYQADVDEAEQHLTAAIAALVKVDAGTSSEPAGNDDSDVEKSGSGVDTADVNNMLLYTITALLAMAVGTVAVSRRKSDNVK